MRSQPKNLSAKEVVEEGKKAGIALSALYVHSVRCAARKKAGRPSKKVAPLKRAPEVIEARKVKGKPWKAPTSSSQADKAFMAEILKIGISRAKEIIALVDHFGLS